MNKLPLCAVLLLAFPSFAQITFTLNKAATWGSTGSTCVVQFPNLDVSKNLIVVWTTWQTSGTNSASVASVSDTEGNGIGSIPVYESALEPTLQPLSNNAAQIFFAKNIVGGTKDKVTVTFAGSAVPGFSAGCVIAEFSGLDLSNPLDTTSATFGLSKASTLDSGAAAPANANILIFAGGNSNITAGSLNVSAPLTPLEQSTDGTSDTGYNIVTTGVGLTQGNLTFQASSRDCVLGLNS